MRPSLLEKSRHIAVLLPVFGLLLLMPPALLVFDIDGKVAGVPVIVFYIFGVWAGLIIGAAILSRYLDQRAPALSPDQADERPGPDRPALSRYPPS